MPSASVENYLKALYHLGGHEHAVKTKALAEALNVSLPSVSNMVQALANDGMVEHQPYKGTTLTQKGCLCALQVIRKHRLIEMFLVQTLAYTWDEVHAEAEQLEHAVSDLMAHRMDAYLGSPEFDPHGDPIPTAEGVVQRRATLPLSELSTGCEARVVRVLDQNPEVLRHLSQLGLVPDVRVQILGVLSFDGQMTLAIGAREVEVSQKLASQLMVMESK